jgi:SRSO17 transposase
VVSAGFDAAWAAQERGADGGAVHPQNVRSAHQSMHHLVADAEWNDTALLAAVAHEVVPVLTQAGTVPCFWILDDTGYRKYGKHSVGVARQYCEQLGKTDNCQVAVSLSLATAEGSLPLDYRLYLPKEWLDDASRCARVGIPEQISFATKGEIAWKQIEAALAAGIPLGTILMDAAYGDEAALRDRLRAQELPYAVGIKPATGVWWDAHQPASAPEQGRAGRVRVCCATTRANPLACWNWRRHCPRLPIVPSRGEKAATRRCVRALQECVCAQRKATTPATKNGC